MKKNILVGIIILVILIILVLGILIIDRKQANKEHIQEGIHQFEETKEEMTISEMVEPKKVYALELLINYYMNDIIITIEESEEEATQEREILKQLGIGTDKQFLSQNAYSLELNEKNTLYFVKGEFIYRILDDAKNRKKQGAILTLTVDKENQTFDILPYRQEFSNLIDYQEEILDSKIVNVEELKKVNKEIQESYFNYYSDIEVTDEEMAKRYYQDYKRNALYFTEEAYKRIEEEYKQIRFPTFSKYQEYLYELKDEMEEAELVKYGVDEKGQYTLMDNLQNSYFIRKSTRNTMDYKIMLDSYTIKTEDFEEKYNKLSSYKKVETNAHIFLQMLNTRDYENAYKLLDPNFKKNNFNTLEEFKNYATNHLLHTSIETSASIHQEGTVFVYDLKLRDNDNNTQSMTIIMKLLEETNFVMSFSIE